MAYHLYILQSESTGRFYVGQTEHLKERVEYHNANYSLSLRNRGPWKLMYSEQYETRREAMRREQYIKRQKDRHFIEALLSASRWNREGRGFPASAGHRLYLFHR